MTSTGTAFFVSQNGHIVTNAHVVDGCQAVRASRGGSLRKISTDEASDLALYVASEKPNSFARLRGGRGARTGEPVVAVGFPLSGVLSSDPIVTTGIISALSGWATIADRYRFPHQFSRATVVVLCWAKTVASLVSSLESSMR